MANFSVLPPEVNSALMYAGAGSAPLLEAASSWDEVAADLESTADSFAAVTSELVGGSWQGAAASAMTAVATPYAGWLSAAAAQADAVAAQSRVAADAFDAALAATVPPELVQALRSGLISLVLSNLFGQNAPAIAALEAFYEQMWAQDVAAMAGYHAAVSAAASVLTPWQPPPAHVNA